MCVYTILIVTLQHPGALPVSSRVQSLSVCLPKLRRMPFPLSVKFPTSCIKHSFCPESVQNLFLTAYFFVPVEKGYSILGSREGKQNAILIYTMLLLSLCVLRQAISNSIGKIKM